MRGNQDLLCDVIFHIERFRIGITADKWRLKVFLFFTFMLQGTSGSRILLKRVTWEQHGSSYPALRGEESEVNMVVNRQVNRCPTVEKKNPFNL